MGSWEEVFKNFRDKTPEQVYRERYGPVVGPWLLEFEARDTDMQASSRAKERYEYLQKFFRSFTDDVPQQIQEDFIKGLNFNKDYILENLQSHDWVEMAKQLNRRFKANDSGVEAVPDHGSSLSRVVWFVRSSYEMNRYEFIQNLSSEESEIGKSFRNIIKFYGYFVASVGDGKIFLEPEWPESAAEFVYKTCGGEAYILVPAVNTPFVLKNGLKCRNGNIHEFRKLFKQEYGRYPTKEEENSNFVPYKFFPRRIYFCAFEFGSSLMDELETVADELGRPWESVSVFKINLKGHNISVYRDPAMRSKNAFFTYENIPPQLLKLVKKASKDYWEVS